MAVPGEGSTFCLGQQVSKGHASCSLWYEFTGEDGNEQQLTHLVMEEKNGKRNPSLQRQINTLRGQWWWDAGGCHDLCKE